ncbi:MAG: hypothetical protein V9G98_13125 [Candidatus Competibacter sp.]
MARHEGQATQGQGRLDDLQGHQVGAQEEEAGQGRWCCGARCPAVPPRARRIETPPSPVKGQ